MNQLVVVKTVAMFAWKALNVREGYNFSLTLICCLMLNAPPPLAAGWAMRCSQAQTKGKLQPPTKSRLNSFIWAWNASDMMQSGSTVAPTVRKLLGVRALVE